MAVEVYRHISILNPWIEPVVIIDVSIVVIVQSIIRYFLFIDPEIIDDIFMAPVKAGIHDRNHNGMAPRALASRGDIPCQF